LASTVGEIEPSVTRKIVMVALWVAISAALYSLWTGASWPVAVLWAIAIVAFVVAIRWFSQRRREG
jgi:hypothetical protein